MTHRYGICLLISGLITLQTGYSNNPFQPVVPQQEESVKNPTDAAEVAELADKVHTIVNNLLSLLNNVTARIDNLSIETETKRENTEQLLSIQEKLFKIKKNLPSFSTDKTKLVKLLDLLALVSKGLEKGLQDSFTETLAFTDEKPQSRSYRNILGKAASFSAKKLSKLFSAAHEGISNALKIAVSPLRKQAITPDTEKDPVKELLAQTEMHILESEKLIQNLGKTWVNKAYGAFMGWARTPLFHIAPLGNTPVTPEAIGKRVVIYGLNTVLIIYNLNQKFIDTIPFSGLRDTLTAIKGKLGQHPTMVESMHPATQNQETKNKYILLPSEEEIGRINPSTGKPYGLTADRYITLATLPSNAVAIEKANEKYTVIDEALGQCIETFESKEQILSRVRHVGNQFEYNDRIITETRDPLTGEEKWFSSRHVSGPFSLIQNVSEDDATEYRSGNEISAQKALLRYIGSDGQEVKPRIVLDDAASGGNGAEKSTEKRFGNTTFDRMLASVSWFVEPDLKANLLLPVAGWLTSYIYEDMTELKYNIPNIINWAHSKLSGEEPKLERHFDVAKITFDDVVGRDAIKEKLMPYIKFVENPKLALQAGINVPRGIIFAGEPQTGKTMMAEAFLGELSEAVKKQGSGRLFRMITVKVNELTQFGLKPYLEYMKQYAPCLVFCDEFELTGAQRNENRQLLADFLTALSGFGSSGDIDKMVFFLVATNHPENIDHALQEPGRLGTHIYFETPSAKERRKYFTHSFDKAHILTQDLNIDELVIETAACSFGSLKDIFSGIISRAQHSKGSSVTQDHIDRTLDEMIRRIVIDEYDIPMEQRLALAARYGAQAFTSLVLNPHKKFIGATIYKITPDFKNKIVAKNYALLEKNSNYSVENKKVLQATDSHPSMIHGGFFSYNVNDTLGLISHDEKLKLCKIALAGTIGQEVLGLSKMDFDSDMLVAYQYAHEIVFNGVKEEWLSETARDAKRDEVWRLIQKCKAEIRTLLEANKEDYRKIVDLLQRRYIIRTSDVKECFNLTSLDLSSYFTRLTADQKSATV